MPDEATGILARFWRKVDVRESSECWAWKAGKSDTGYGAFWSNEMGQNVMAHRFAYECANGPIPDGLTLDHLCRNHGCVNPRHLEPVSRGENVLRGIGPSATNARKVLCIRGHEFDGACMTRGKMYRYCKTCHRNKMRHRNRKATLTRVAGGSYA